MEDLKQRLKFDDIAVRSRCLQKVVHSVKRKSKGEIITSSTVQIPELNLIWETCADESTTTSNLAVRGIIYLVTNHYLDGNHAINKLLGILSSSSNIYGIVKGITRLIIHQSNKMTEGNESFCYSLNRPKHPLIAVLETNEDYLPLILENIADTISEDNLRGFQAMEPIICYILSNPAKKNKSDCPKMLLLETLIETVKSEPKTAFYILRCIPLLQVEDYNQVVEAANFILKANNAFDSFQCEESDRIYISELLLLSSLSLSERSILFGHEPTRLLDVAINVGCSLAKINYTSSYVNLCLVLVAIIMKRTSDSLIDKYVTLALVLLDFKGVSSTVAAFLSFSVIQLLPEPSVISFDETAGSTLPQLLEELEPFFLNCQTLENSTSESVDECGEAVSVSTAFDYSKSENFIYIESFTLSVESALQCANFAMKLDESNLDFKLNWLKSVKEIVEQCSTDNLEVIFSLVAALFLMFPDNPNYLSSCLDTFEAILKKNTFLSTKIFALLLYKKSLVKSPESKFLMLEFFPKSATHKYAIPPILSILQMMANNVELKAQAVHLMLQLWKKHDRCFSYLHKILLENNKIVNRELGINEALISQAAAIREICLIAPEKHGIEFLGTLSKVFNESNDEASSPAACLALDGVISLCKSEITDLRSTWKILGPNLSKDRRTLVMCRMYQLLSLVPELQVKSSEYDKFMNEIAAYIWKRISSGIMPPGAVSSAYKAIGKFPIDCYLLKQLPAPAKANLQLPASMKATPFEMSKLPEDVLTYIPGYCFIDLLKSIENSIVIKGYTEFLNEIIKKEVTELPRSVYSQRAHLQKRQNTHQTLSKVPQFLCGHFETRKSPTLQKNLAVGVLLCFEPPLETGKDGEPIKRSLACQYRFYEQVLAALLNEVNIDTTEWQRCILLPSAWGNFMERAFFACEESRKAELELQRNLGHNNLSPDDFSLQCKSAWLWVCERLLSVVKTSVKNAPTSHANAVFAISGLVCASNKFRSSLGDSSNTTSNDNENNIRHQDLMEECTETILCAMMPNYHPKGKVHSWLLTHLSRPNSSSGFLVRGCGCASLCHLTSVLVSTHLDEIPQLVQDLKINLSHSSPVLSFYSGVGLGLFIRSLCEVGYADSGGSQMELLLKTANEISNICCSEDTPHASALISLTMTITSLSHLSYEESKDWISTTCNVFQEKLMEEEVTSVYFEMLTICVSAMVISAADGSCMSIETVRNLASWFEERQSDLPQCSGISVSSGMLIEALERFGHSQGVEIKKKLQTEWFNTLSSEKKPTLHRLAALNGLCSLYSCGRGLLQVKSKDNGVGKSSVDDLVSLMFQILNAGRDTGLQTICSWEVGRLYSVHSFQQESDGSVPLSYSYLSEKSILKPLMKMILTNQSPGEEPKPATHHLMASLSALKGEFSRPLPPLNWITVLTPFLQQNENSLSKEAALDIAAHQAKGSPYATTLVSSYCCPPLFHTLPETCQQFLLKRIPDLTLVLPPNKLKVFLQTVISLTIKKENSSPDPGNIVMQGIQDAFTRSGLKPQTLSVLQDAFVSVFKYFQKDWILIQKHLKWIATIFSYLSERLMESLLSVSRNSKDISALTTVMCYLVKIEKKQLSSLRPYIEEGKHSSLENKELICAALYQCFLTGSQNEKSEVNQPERCISWLLETIGWINVLNETKSQYQLMAVGEVFLFLNDVCLVTLIGCSGLECSYNLLPMQRLSHQLLFESLPIAITKLSTKEGWKKVIDKLINWLMMLLQSPHVKESDRHYIKLSLCALRSSSEFKNLDIWTKVISSIY